MVCKKFKRDYKTGKEVERASEKETKSESKKILYVNRGEDFLMQSKFTAINIFITQSEMQSFIDRLFQSLYRVQLRKLTEFQENLVLVFSIRIWKIIEI